MKMRSSIAMLMVGISISFSAGACAPTNGRSDVRSVTVCEMNDFRDTDDVFLFAAEYYTDGMSHTFFLGDCEGRSTIDAAAKASDSDGSFEAFLDDRKKECANRGITTPCPLKADVEGRGRIVKTPWGYGLEVVSLAKYRFREKDKNTHGSP